MRLQLREYFRPEFLNRVDEVIVFRPLNEEQLKEIVDLLLAGVEGRLAESGIGLELTDAARAFVAREGYDPTYGARPLRRAIQRSVENPLAKAMLGGEFTRGDTVLIDVRDGALAFEKRRPGREKRSPPSRLDLGLPVCLSSGHHAKRQGEH